VTADAVHERSSAATSSAACWTTSRDSRRTSPSGSTHRLGRGPARRPARHRLTTRRERSAGAAVRLTVAQSSTGNGGGWCRTTGTPPRRRRPGPAGCEGWRPTPNAYQGLNRGRRAVDLVRGGGASSPRRPRVREHPEAVSAAPEASWHRCRRDELPAAARVTPMGRPRITPATAGRRLGSCLSRVEGAGSSASDCAREDAVACNPLCH
jgi:hypothetical protein